MTNAIVRYEPKRNTIYNWDALLLAQTMPSESVNCIVTSPPYYGLRDYGADGQIGLEETPQRYVDSLVRLFRELRRVLRRDGTLWLNLGDSYANTPVGTFNGGGFKDASAIRGTRDLSGHKTSGNVNKIKASGLKQKDLIGIPWMVAFALRADGWYLRSDIIWSKPNPMPESVEDRPTKAHEYIFLLTKSAKYFYDAEAIKEVAIGGRGGDFSQKYAQAQPEHGRKQDETGNRRYTGFNGRWKSRTSLPVTRNKRTVWEVSTKPFTGSHFATFPEDLIEPMILAGCPKTCCAECGAPFVRVVERTTDKVNEREGVAQALRNAGAATGGTHKVTLGVTQFVSRETVGFTSTCACNGDTKHGLVYDPFMGAGTTALVAQRLGRDYLGSELNAEYAEMARWRVAGRIKDYLAMKEGKPYRMPLFDTA